MLTGFCPTNIIDTEVALFVGAFLLCYALEQVVDVV
jgi:hypothetical protein